MKGLNLGSMVGRVREALSQRIAAVTRSLNVQPPGAYERV
jgi:hypothetical protein